VSVCLVAATVANEDLYLAVPETQHVLFVEFNLTAVLSVF